MTNQEIVFGIFLKDRRTRLNLSPAALAARLGYRNINKGIRRIEAVEKGETEPYLTARIMNQLAVTPEERAVCQKQESNYRRQLLEKLPGFRPALIWRAMACVYVPEELPENLCTHEQMLAYATELARTRNSQCCLELDYDLRYWISPKGETCRADKTMKNGFIARPDIAKLLFNSPFNFKFNE